MRCSRLACAIYFMLAAAGCDSAGDNGIIIEPPPEIEGEMTADVGGRAFVADSSVHAWFIGSTLVVEGQDSTGRAIRISLLNADAIGTYLIAGPQSGPAQAEYHTALQEYGTIADSAGSLNLTRLDSLAARGTFSFVAFSLSSGPISVQQGQFLAPLGDRPSAE